MAHIFSNSLRPFISPCDAHCDTACRFYALQCKLNLWTIKNVKVSQIFFTPRIMVNDVLEVRVQFLHVRRGKILLSYVMVNKASKESYPEIAFKVCCMWFLHTGTSQRSDKLSLLFHARAQIGNKFRRAFFTHKIWRGLTWNIFERYNTGWHTYNKERLECA